MLTKEEFKRYIELRNKLSTESYKNSFIALDMLINSNSAYYNDYKLQFRRYRTGDYGYMFLVNNSNVQLVDMYVKFDLTTSKPRIESVKLEINRYARIYTYSDQLYSDYKKYTKLTTKVKEIKEQISPLTFKEEIEGDWESDLTHRIDIATRNHQDSNQGDAIPDEED